LNAGTEHPCGSAAGNTIEEWVRFVVIERASGVFVIQVIVLLAFVFTLVWSIFHPCSWRRTLHALRSLSARSPAVGADDQRAAVEEVM
jgi:hypothetical protein